VYDLCAAEFKVLFPDVAARVEEIDRLATFARVQVWPSIEAASVTR